MKQRTFGQQLSDRLVQLGLASPNHGWGCTLVEVEKVKQAQQISYLPPQYIEFLLEMGKGTSSPFFQGEDYTHDRLLEMKLELLDIIDRIREHGGYKHELPKSAFVFLGHQGVFYYFFETTDQDPDPPVYLFDEDDENSARIVCDHLSEFFMSEVDYIFASVSRSARALREKLRNEEQRRQPDSIFVLFSRAVRRLCEKLFDKNKSGHAQ